MDVSNQENGTLQEKTTRLTTLKTAWAGISRLLKVVLRAEGPTIDHGEAGELGVSISGFDLSDGDTDSRQFFRPYTDQRSFDAAFEKLRPGCEYVAEWRKRLYTIAGPANIETNLVRYLVSEIDWWTADEENPEDMLVAWAGWECHQYDTGEDSLRLNSYGDSNDRHWEVYHHFSVRNSNRPHVACPLIRLGDCSDTIHQSELITILRLMKEAMETERNEKPLHERSLIHPVALYSITSDQARVLHAWHAAGTLHIRISNWITIAEDEVANIKLYLRWMMSEPVMENEEEGRSAV